MKTILHAALLTTAVVVMVGIGCGVMGLRHSGAHILVESVSVFVVSWVGTVASASVTLAALRGTASRSVSDDVARLREELDAARVTIRVLSRCDDRS